MCGVVLTFNGSDIEALFNLLPGHILLVNIFRCLFGGKHSVSIAAVWVTTQSKCKLEEEF